MLHPRLDQGLWQKLPKHLVSEKSEHIRLFLKPKKEKGLQTFQV